MGLFLTWVVCGRSLMRKYHFLSKTLCHTKWLTKWHQDMLLIWKKLVHWLSCLHPYSRWDWKVWWKNTIQSGLALEMNVANSGSHSLAIVSEMSYLQSTCPKSEQKLHAHTFSLLPTSSACSRKVGTYPMVIHKPFIWCITINPRHLYSDRKTQRSTCFEMRPW